MEKTKYNKMWEKDVLYLTNNFKHLCLIKIKLDKLELSLPYVLLIGMQLKAFSL